MTSSKSTKRALISSALAILMCAAMLIGTTFAWFTDTASTGVNKIVSGNLDIAVEYRTSSEGDWKTIDNATDLFGAEGTLFEPGHTRVVELRITNAGNLALKYKIGMNIVSETAGTNKAGNPYKLSDYLKVATTGIQQYNPTDQISSLMEQLIFQRGDFGMWTARDFANFELEYTSSGNVHVLQPGAAQILGIKVYMPESVGNESLCGNNTEREGHQVRIERRKNRTADDQPLQGRYHQNGINVWRMFYDGNSVTWKKLFGMPYDVDGSEMQEFSAAFEENGITVTHGERSFFLRIEDLPEKYYAGVDACEGICRFYSITAKE